MNTTTNFPKNAVCAPSGQPIAFPNDLYRDADRLAELINERFGRSFFATRGDGNDDQIYILPRDPRSEKPLTALERAAVEGLAWYCTAYSEGVKRGTSVTLPRIIHDHSDADVIAGGEALSFGDEGRAYMFAEVAESCFPVEAEVVEVATGWAVVISNALFGVSAETLCRLQGACRVLLDYPVAPAAPAYASSHSERLHDCPDPDTRNAWRDRKNATLKSIEQKLDAVLSYLDDPDIPGTAGDVFAAGRDNHRRPVKSTRKPVKKA